MRPYATLPAVLLAVALLAASGAARALVLPRLLSVDTTGSDTAHFGLPAGPVQTPVTQVRLRFDAALLPALPGPSAFRVVSAGADGVLQTSACTALPVDDDAFVTLAEVIATAAPEEVALDFGLSRGLPRGRYRVLACQAQSGFDQRDFSIEEPSLLRNPTFDPARGAGGWWASSVQVPAQLIFAPALDADAAATSGALRVLSGSGHFAMLVNEECIALDSLLPGDASSWRLRLRHRVVSGNVRITAAFSHGFSGDMGEGRCLGPYLTDEAAFDAGPAAGFSAFDSGWRRLDDPMPRGMFALVISARDGLPFEIVLDDIGLRLDTGVIFRDSFD